MKTLDYKVIASGSSGNAVRIENIMIDCGIAYNRMKDDLYKCDTLLITHAHGDHLKPSTLKKIREEFPRIEICANPDVAYRYFLNRIITTHPFDTGRNHNVHVIPYEGKHDIPVTYFILQIKGLNIFYATDTSAVSNPDGFKFDYIFLEANYDEYKLKELSSSYSRKGYNALESSMRHLSVQQCRTFYYLNRRSKETPLIELHKSKRFY